MAGRDYHRDFQRLFGGPTFGSADNYGHSYEDPYTEGASYFLPPDPASWTSSGAAYSSSTADSSKLGPFWILNCGVHTYKVWESDIQPELQPELYEPTGLQGEVWPSGPNFGGKNFIFEVRLKGQPTPTNYSARKFLELKRYYNTGLQMAGNQTDQAIPVLDSYTNTFNKYILSVVQDHEMIAQLLNQRASVPVPSFPPMPRQSSRNVPVFGSQTPMQPFNFNFPQ